VKWLRGKAGSEQTGPQVVLKVDGMHCSTVHLADEGSPDASTLIAAVERAGYQATVLD